MTAGVQGPGDAPSAWHGLETKDYPFFPARVFARSSTTAVSSAPTKTISAA